jgi:hypothetical protein
MGTRSLLAVARPLLAELVSEQGGWGVSRSGGGLGSSHAGGAGCVSGGPVRGWWAEVVRAALCTN